MPAYEHTFPVGTYNLQLRDVDGNVYLLDTAVHTFTRTGKDGAEHVLALFSGDEFEGEYLDGYWKKGWDTNMDSNQTFTVMLDGSGTLAFQGEADTPGTLGNGWINNSLPLPLLSGLEISISMQVPIDDTGEDVDRDIYFDFYLREDNVETAPYSDNNYFNIRQFVDEIGTLISIRKEIDGSITVYDQGYDYTMSGGKGTGNIEGCIWRIKFNGSPGTTGATVSVYLKQSNTITNAEGEAENELNGSPYDTSDWNFNVAFPAFLIRSRNGTYYDAVGEAKCTYIRVTYPKDVQCEFNVPDANRLSGNVQLWDERGVGSDETRWQQVNEKEHDFVGDIYLQNGLVRLCLSEGTAYSCKYYGYYGGDYNTPNENFVLRLEDDGEWLNYAYLYNIDKNTPEETVIRVKWTEDATNDDDYYIITKITLRRGSYSFEHEMTEVHPPQNTQVGDFYDINNKLRFGYVGDVKIGDDDLNLTGTNTTFSDNFMVAFDDAGDACLAVLSTSKQPDNSPTRYVAYEGGLLAADAFSASLSLLNKFWVTFIPFSDNDNLFREAESVTLSGGATSVSDGAASGGNAALLNANGEATTYNVTAGTDLPAGRYLAVFRIRDTAQVADDVKLLLWNSTDGSSRSRYNASVRKTATASYLFYTDVLDITASDVSGTDNIQVQCSKATATPNSIYVDCMLLIPMSDGESFPQDIAHNNLYTKKLLYDVFQP